MNARNVLFILLVLLGIAAVASSAYALSADTFGCPAACGGQGTVPSTECKPTMTSLTVNGAPFDSTKVYTVAELLSPNTCVEFTTPCQFQMATFEVWNTKEAHANCASRDYSQLVTLGVIGAKGSTLALNPAGPHKKICANANTMSATSKSRINSATFTGRNFRAELCPKENAPECKAGCGWLEIIPQGQGEAPPVGCPQGCDDKNPCTEDTCNVSTCAFKKEIMEGKQVTVGNQTCTCVAGKAENCTDIQLPSIYISKAGVSGSETPFAAGAKDKAVNVKLTDKLNIEAKNVKKNTALSLFKGGCPQTETTENILAKINAIGVTSDTQQFTNVVVNTFSSAQQVSICQYDGSALRSDSLTVNTAPDATPCTNLICALAKIDIKFVLDIFR